MVVTPDLETRPVGSEGSADLAVLFEGNRNTRRCWCTAFCASRGQFAAGWLTGGNRRRFETLATTSRTALGMLASMAGEPVGWCACGPRSRYAVAEKGRSKLLRSRDRSEDELVWLVPCLFVRAGFQGHGITYTLVRSAVELARREGALAVEGWPVAASRRPDAPSHLGREEMFEALGFRCVGRPAPDRAIMRLELADGPEPGRPTAG